MGKKLGLMTSFFNRMARTSRSPSSPPSSRPCLYSCKHPETLSFRKEDVSSSSCLSSAADDVEEVIRGVLKSDGRLFFEPAGRTRLMVSSGVGTNTTAPASAATIPFEGGVAVAVDSADPYWDFKASMAEMVTARGGVEDWEWLEEMLVWYLKMNEKRNHGVIVGAFRDLILSLACNTSSTSSPPPRSSSFTFEEEDADYESS